MFMSVTKVFWHSGKTTLMSVMIVLEPHQMHTPSPFFHVSMIDPSAVDDIRYWLYVFPKSARKHDLKLRSSDLKQPSLTEERKILLQYIIAIPGRISMLSRPSSSISIATRQTTSSSPPRHLQPYTLSVFVSEQDECLLSPSPCRALIFDFKFPSPSLSLSRVSKSGPLIMEKVIFYTEELHLKKIFNTY